MTSWKISKINKVKKTKDARMIVGLPGIGNVGKLALDFLVDDLKAKPIYRFFSYTMPHSVFVNENHLLELPKITLYFHKKSNTFLLGGDVQPGDEVSCYEFCDAVLDIFQELGGTEIVSLGGVGLREAPEKPLIYCTGTSKDAVKRYKKGVRMKSNLYGIVGPIMGVSGVILGLASERGMEGVSMLAETLGHPMYFGVDGSKKLLSILNKKFDFSADVKRFEKELKVLDGDGEEKTLKKSKAKQVQATKKQKKEMNYIG